MARYAIIESDLVTNIAEAEAAYAESQGWLLAPDNVGPGYAYDTTTGTWTAPPVPVSVINQQETVTQVGKDLETILAWLAANPDGAVLTAAQTRVLARIIANLCIYDLRDFSQSPVTT